MAIAFSLVLDFVILVVMGFCGQQCWNMFVPHIFPQLPQLSFGGALGILLVYSIFHGSNTQQDWTEEEGKIWTNAVANQVMNGIGKPIMILIYAFIVHWFLGW